MAGLLDTIARRLFGINKKKKRTRTASMVRVKPVEMPCVDESMDNLTMWNEKESDVVVGDFVEEFGEKYAGEDVVVIEGEQIEYDDGFEKDDYLLNQIDEFRVKAQQLQSLLLSKESKVAELQTIVDEREGKAKELEDILIERQKEAEGVTAAMRSQIDSLIEKITSKMDDISNNITASVTDSLEASTSVMGKELLNVGKELEGVKDEMSNNRQLNENQMAGFGELKDSLGSLPTSLEEAKTEILEKVHAENVKCYRNTSDLVKGLEDKMDKMRSLEMRIDSLQKSSTILTILSSISIAGLVIVGILASGIFG